MDLARRQRLLRNIAQIEARERDERATTATALPQAESATWLNSPPPPDVSALTHENAALNTGGVAHTANSEPTRRGLFTVHSASSQP